MPPTTNLPPGLENELGWSGASSTWGTQTWEETADLRFPNNVLVYDRIRKTDNQVAAVLRAITLPIRRANWKLQGDDVRPEVMTFVERNLGLRTSGSRRRRRRQGISFSEVNRQALLMLAHGFAPFEQVYRIGPPDGDLAGVMPAQVAHLRKMAYRPPRTIQEVVVARDGGLKGLKQLVPDANGLGWVEKELGVEALVFFVNEREGADWYGQSLLRSIYKNWLIKEGLLRLGPVIVEKNGLGVPVVAFDKSGSRAEAMRVARGVRVGEDMAIAEPEGYKFRFESPAGGTRDELPLVKYHDEAIGRGPLAMFLNLGHDRGSQSLGQTFVDFFLMSNEAVAEELAETWTEHVIRDLVELNFPEDEPYPELVCEPLDAAQPVTAEALKVLVEAGVLTVSDADERDVRRRYRMPAMPQEADGPPEDTVEGYDEVPLPNDGGGDDPLEPPSAPPGVVEPGNPSIPSLESKKKPKPVKVKDHERPTTGQKVAGHRRGKPASQRSTTRATAVELEDRVARLNEALEVLRGDRESA